MRAEDEPTMLLKRAKDGDQEARDRLYQIAQDVVRQAVRWNEKRYEAWRVEDENDTVQEIMGDIQRIIAKFDPERGESLTAYLRTAVRYAMNRRRDRVRAAHRARAAARAHDRAFARPPIDGWPHGDLGRKVLRALDGSVLTNREEEAIRLRHGSNMSLAEIAETMSETGKSITPESVSAHLSKAHKKLLKHLTDSRR